MSTAPAYLSDPIAIEEWDRVCSKHYSNGEVPDDVAGPLAIYCGIHGSLAGAIKKGDIGILVKLAPLVGQYRTLAAALFGRGSTRQQPGKNPFADLKGRKARAHPRRNPYSLTASHAIEELTKLVDFFRSSESLHLGDEGDANHWTPAETAIRAMRRLLSANQRALSDRKNYAAPASGPKPRAKTKGRNSRK